MAAPRPWSELKNETTWTEEIDGWVYRLRDPSVTRLMGKGVVLPSVEIKDGRVISRTPSGQEKTFYLTDKEQEIVLRDVLVEPVIYDGKGEAPEGAIRFLDMGSHADVLVISVIKKIYGGALVRAATFRGEQPEGPVGAPDGEGGVDVPAGRPEAAGG